MYSSDKNVQISLQINCDHSNNSNDHLSTGNNNWSNWWTSNSHCRMYNLLTFDNSCTQLQVNTFTAFHSEYMHVYIHIDIVWCKWGLKFRPWFMLADPVLLTPFCLMLLQWSIYTDFSTQIVYNSIYTDLIMIKNLTDRQDRSKNGVNTVCGFTWQIKACAHLHSFIHDPRAGQWFGTLHTCRWSRFKAGNINYYFSITNML